MKKKEENLKSFSAEELKKRLSELEEKMRSLKFKAEGAKSKNVKEGRNLRKEIARTLTEMSDPKRKQNSHGKK